MITIELSNTGLVRRLPLINQNIRAALKREISKQAVDLQRYIVQNKLSAPPGYSATMLHRITSNLARSIQQQVSETPDSITAKVYSAGDVKYAAVHEYGLSVTRFGKKAGDYTVHYPERSFMRSSLRENKDKIVAGMSRAVGEGLRK